VRNLSIELYCIYACYKNITLYIAFSIFHNHSRSWNILPTEMAVHLSMTLMPQEIITFHLSRNKVKVIPVQAWKST